MTNISTESTITISTTYPSTSSYDSVLNDDNQTYFTSSGDSDFGTDSSIIINSQHDGLFNTTHSLIQQHHPLSQHLVGQQQQKIHFALLLDRRLSVPPPPSSSILQKIRNRSPAIPKHVFVDDSKEQRRRSSTVTCSSNDSNSHTTIFYDAVSTTSKIASDDNEADNNNATTSNSKRESTATADKKRNGGGSITDLTNKHPSLMSHISTAYSNKTATITIDHVDLDISRYLHQGTLLCAVVSTQQRRIEEHIKYNHSRHHEFRKIPLKWQEYRAQITQSGYLKLYNVCYSKKELLHAYLHPFYNKPKHIIDLHPSTNNSLFRNELLLLPHRKKSPEIFFLSLMSPIDFSWKLSSLNNVYYFQAHSLAESQAWYRSLYTAVPFRSKRPLPENVDLIIPELTMLCIRLPIAELIKEEDKNVELKRVLESALVLLHKIGKRPSNWTKRTVGLCWKLKHGNHLDWVLKPADVENSVTNYLIEPRLIEKTHELQMRYYIVGKEQVEESRSDVTKGYLVDQSSSSLITKENTILYATTMDHYLFLFQNNLQAIPSSASTTTNMQFLTSYCFNNLLNRKKNNQTFPSDMPPQQTQNLKPKSVIGVIDPSKVKCTTEETLLDKNKDKLTAERQNSIILYLDNKYTFKITNQPKYEWTRRLKAIQDYYKSSSSCESDMQEGYQIQKSGMMYLKIIIGRFKSPFSTFERRLCILTNTGDLCIFKYSTENYKALDYNIPLSEVQQNKRDIYVFSGEECCSYIPGLPLCWSSRIFKDGIVMENYEKNRPGQCCFVVHYQKKNHVFLTRSQEEKEAWIQSIFTLLL